MLPSGVRSRTRNHIVAARGRRGLRCDGRGGVYPGVAKLRETSTAVRPSPERCCKVLTARGHDRSALRWRTVVCDMDRRGPSGKRGSDCIAAQTGRREREAWPGACVFGNRFGQVAPSATRTESGGERGVCCRCDRGRWPRAVEPLHWRLLTA